MEILIRHIYIFAYLQMEVIMNKTESVAARLGYIMKQRGLKQVDVLNLTKPYCEKYHVKLAKNYLSQYCNGKNEPGKDILNVLSLALDVNPLWLQGFDVPQTSTDMTGSDNITAKNVEANDTNTAFNINVNNGSLANNNNLTQNGGYTKMKSFKKSSKLTDGNGKKIKIYTAGY